jgi:hypothetical protein
VRSRSTRLAIAAASLALGGLACSQPAGLRVDVNFGDFTGAHSLQVAIGALPGGFKPETTFNVSGASVTTEDFDGDGALDLVATFLGPFSSTSSFLVDTGNDVGLEIQAHALAFDASNVIAGADATGTLSGGGRTSIALDLTARNGGSVGPATRTTDLGTASTDLAIEGAFKNGHLGALAACDLDHDGVDDLILGAPDADDTRGLGGVGAVYVVFGGAASGPTIDLSTASGEGFHFFGLNGGDHLGAAVACADLNDDSYADLIVGAPGGTDGTGNVYAVFGGSNLKTNKVINLASTNQLPDVHWQTNVAGANLGAALYAGDLDADHRAEILVSAPGEQMVHLYTNVAATAAPIDVELPDHVTFSGLSATAITAGDLDGDTANTGAPLDLAFGVPSYRAPNDIVSSGAVYLFSDVNPVGTTQYGSGAGAANPPTVMMVGDQMSQYGASVLAFDSGGGQDLLVGVPGDGSGTGSVFVYDSGSTFFVAPLRLSTTHQQTISGLAAGGRFGSALASSASGSAGSGGARLVVGAPQATFGNGRTQAGAAYLFQGNAARSFPLLEQLFGAAAMDQLGTAVAGGKLNAGDLIGDLVAAAPYATGADTQSGVVYLRFGR